MSLKITVLSQPLKLKIYEKLSISALCRLRATCKEINVFIEEHRYDLSSRRLDDRTLDVTLSANGLAALASKNGHFKANLPHPFEQTSALALNLYIKIREPVSQEVLDELVLLAQKVKCATLLLFDDSFTRNYLETCMTVASLCSYQILNTITGEASLSRYLSIPSVQNSKGLAIGKMAGDDIPVEGFLKQIENMKKVDFEIEGNSDHIVHNVIPQILKDAVSYEKQVPLPLIGFLLNELTDITKEFPNLRLIYREMEPPNSYTRNCYALALPQKIFLMTVSESVIYDPWQELEIQFVSKEKNALKKALTDNLGHISGRLMDHIYNILVRDQ